MAHGLQRNCFTDITTLLCPHGGNCSRNQHLVLDMGLCRADSVSHARGTGEDPQKSHIWEMQAELSLPVAFPYLGEIGFDFQV